MFTVEPECRFNLVCIDHQLPASKICSKTYHKRVLEGPGLAPEITDILNRNYGFFKDLAHKVMLKVLTGLNKSCNKANIPGGNRGERASRIRSSRCTSTMKTVGNPGRKGCNGKFFIGNTCGWSW